MSRLAIWIVSGLLIVGFTSWKAFDLGQASARAQAQAEVDQANQAKKEADDRYEAGLTDRAALLAAATAALSRPPPDPRVLLKPVPMAPGATTCTDRSPDFRLRYNAAASGATP